jgi:hypothetical protein
VEELAAKAADDIGVGLAERVGRAGMIVGRADIRQLRRRRDAGRRQLQLLQRDRGLDLAERDVPERGTQMGGEPRRGLAHLREGGLLVLEAPAPVLAATNIHRT